jgi:K+:H+ antiporter
LMDIRQLPIFILPAIVLVVVSIAAKFFTVFLSARLQGFSTLTALRTGFGLSSSGGELALVVAKGGADSGVTSSFLLPMVGTMTVITTFITPYMIKAGWRFADIIISKHLSWSPYSDIIKKKIRLSYFDTVKKIRRFKLFKK